MKFFFRLLTLTVLLSLLSFKPLLSGFNRKTLGTTSAQFLKLPVGARAASMGEAYTTLSGDSDSLYSNPASLIDLHYTRSLAFSHAVYLDSVQYGFMGYAMRLSNGGALGLGAQYLTYGSIVRTNLAGQELGIYKPQDAAYLLSYAGPIGNTFQFGLTAKSISSKIIASDTTFAIDIGLMSRPIGRRALQLGFTARHLGSGLKFHKESSPLPAELRLGASLAPQQDATVAIDAAFPRDNEAYGALGGEYWYHGTDFSVAGRMGFNTRLMGETGGLDGVSFGFGVRRKAVVFNYALVPFGDLGITHRLGLNFGFGQNFESEYED